MVSQPLYLVRTKDQHLFLQGVSFDDLSLHYSTYMRMSRASWLKQFFGEQKIPRSLFQTVVGAEVTPEILQSWHDMGGLNAVYYYCSVLFGDPENGDTKGIRKIQLETQEAQNVNLKRKRR